MKVLVDKEFLEGGLELICDSIRLKTGGTGVLAFPVEMKEAVDAIETGTGGITPTGTKTITENGEGIDVTTFANVDVAVPIPAPPSGTKQITANGTGIDVEQYAQVDVNVPTGITPTGTKQITANGNGIDVAEYAAVDVEVPTSEGYDAAEMDSGGFIATANAVTKLTAVCLIPKTEGLAGIYISGDDRSTLWTIFSLLLIGSGSTWYAEGLKVGQNGPISDIVNPSVTVTSRSSGIAMEYTFEITLSSSYVAFSTAARNYNVKPIRLVKS